MFSFSAILNESLTLKSVLSGVLFLLDLAPDTPSSIITGLHGGKEENSFLSINAEAPVLTSRTLIKWYTELGASISESVNHKVTSFMYYINNIFRRLTIGRIAAWRISWKDNRLQLEDAVNHRKGKKPLNLELGIRGNRDDISELGDYEIKEIKIKKNRHTNKHKIDRTFLYPFHWKIFSIWNGITFNEEISLFPKTIIFVKFFNQRNTTRV